MWEEKNGSDDFRRIIIIKKHSLTLINKDIKEKLEEGVIRCHIEIFVIIN